MKVFLVISLLVVAVSATEFKLSSKQAKKVVRSFAGIEKNIPETLVHKLLVGSTQNSASKLFGGKAAKSFETVANLYEIDPNVRCDETELLERNATLTLIANELDDAKVSFAASESLSDYLRRCEGKMLAHCIVKNSKATLNFIFKGDAKFRESLDQFLGPRDQSEIVGLMRGVSYKQIFDLYVDFKKRSGAKINSGEGLKWPMIQAFEYNWRAFGLIHGNLEQQIEDTEAQRLFVAFLIYDKLHTGGPIDIDDQFKGSKLIDEFIDTLPHKVSSENCVDPSEESLMFMAETRLDPTAPTDNFSEIERQLEKELRDTCAPKDDESKALFQLIWSGLLFDFIEGNQHQNGRVWKADAVQACGCRFAAPEHVAPISFRDRQ